MRLSLPDERTSASRRVVKAGTNFGYWATIQAKYGVLFVSYGGELLQS